MSYFSESGTINDLKIETLSLMTFSNKIPYVYGYNLVQDLLSLLNIANINLLTLKDMLNYSTRINEKVLYISNYQRYVSEVCLYEDIVTRTKLELGEDANSYLHALSTNRSKINLLGKGKTISNSKEGPFHKDALITLTSNNNILGEVPSEAISKNYVRASYVAQALQGSINTKVIEEGIGTQNIPFPNLTRFPYVCVLEYDSTRYETIVINSADIDAEIINFKIILSFDAVRTQQASSKTRFKFFKEYILFNNINGTKKSSAFKKMFFPKFTFTGVIPSTGDTIIIDSQSSAIKEVLGNSLSVQIPLEEGAGVSVCRLKTKWLNLTRLIFKVHVPNSDAIDLEKERSLFITSITNLKKKLKTYKVKDCIGGPLTDKLSKIKKAHLSNNAGHMLYLLEEGRIKDYYNLADSEADKSRFIGTTVNKIRTIGL